MTTKVTPLGLRLFLEGIEVPVISAQVTMQPDQPALAAIQIIPTEMAMALLPRTLVHLFYIDDEQLETPATKPRQGPDGPENNLNRFTAPDEQYKLLFCGEVIGFNYSKASDNRDLVLQCMDLSSYWDTCYQWFADYSVGGNGLTDKSQHFVGAGTTTFNSVAGGHQWVIGRILETKPQSKAYQNAKGLLGGIIHLLEAIGGIEYTSSGDPGFHGVNDFFTIAELRYHLLAMLGAVEKDETSVKMYNSKAFRSWLKNGMTSLGTLLSFRDILNFVCQHIFHHVYPNPCPYYIPEVVKSTTIPKTVLTDTAEGQSVAESVSAAATSLARARSRVTNQGYVDGVPETYSLVQSGHAKLKDDATGLLAFVKTDDKAKIKASLQKAITLLDSTLTQFANATSPAPQDVSMGVSEGEAGVSSSRNLDEEGMTTQAAKQLATDLDNVLSIIDVEILGISSRSARRGKKTITSRKAPHLYTQLMFPETFFVSPPRCNVIFPDQYYQFQYSRNFMREVTRLSCQGGLGMIAGGHQGAKLLGRSYFAPNIKDASGQTLYATWSKGARILLPHEIHSGIIPKFEWVTDAHRWGVVGAEGNQADPFYASGKVGYVQRLANFQFYLHRWSSRALSISGVFNPNIVLGLPAVILDRSQPAPVVSRMISLAIGRKWVPVQYLGKVVFVTHTIHQQGGQTNVSFSHCRTHRGIDDEFLGALTVQQEKSHLLKYKIWDALNDPTASMIADAKKKEEENATYGAEPKKEPVQQTKHDPMIAKAKQYQEDLQALTRLYMTGALREGQLVPGTRTFRGMKVKKLKTTGNVKLQNADAKKLGVDLNATEVYTRTVTVESEEEAASYEEVITENVDVANVPEAFEITLLEKYPDGAWTREYTRSIEEALTPGWYSEVWGNKKIGKEVYTPLLGIDAITDNISLGSKDQSLLLDQQAALTADTYKNLINSQVTVDNQGDVTISGAGKAPSGTKFQFVSPDETSQGALSEMNVVPGSIEEAIDAITVLYGVLKWKGADMHKFIQDYTKRPIANMVDVLGSPELVFDDSGNKDPALAPQVVEGFHSRAFGDYNADLKLSYRKGVKVQAGKDALKGLYKNLPSGMKPQNVKRKSATDRGEPPSAILPHLDPRGRARLRVRTYLQELRISRGLLG